jgi:SNF2 family DNA or RNA helicase
VVSDATTAWYPACNKSSRKKKKTHWNVNEAKREGITNETWRTIWNQTLENDDDVASAIPANGTSTKIVAPWNTVGECDHMAKLDRKYVGVDALLQLLQEEETSKDGIDQNLAVIQEMIKILEHCQDLMNPNELWNIPLLFVYPVVQKLRGPLSKQNVSKKTKLNAYTYEICLGIYCHRLLPEATTTSLGTIMNTLDPDSYIVLESIHQPPKPNKKTFSSAPYPIVCYDNGLEDEELPLESQQQQQETKKASASDDNVKKEEDWMVREGDRDESLISAFTAKGLLKLLENEGTDVSDFEIRVQPRLRDFRCNLLLHQQHAISWMLQMESLPGFGINSILWEEREFLDGGRYYYCPSLGQLRLEAPAKMWGGMLCDEMGLGKTVEVLGLILASLSDLKLEAQQTFGTHMTLIIVPPALVAQWQAEIIKATGDALTVEYWDAYSPVPSRRPGILRHEKDDPDVVITTYNALEKTTVANLLHEISWGRIVLDEMQEIRSSTSKIAKSCENLKARRRWMLSGTPLFEGIQDFLGEFNFLKLEPFAASNEDGFFHFMISQAWENHAKEAIERLQVLSSVMLRRSKSMTIRETGAPIMGLPPLTVEFVPVRQTESDRALYYFLESIVSQELRSSDDSNGGSSYASGKRSKASRKLCLRLLRDMCNSSILLNGGLGVSSQLMNLHRLLLQAARRSNRETSAVQENDNKNDFGRIVQEPRNRSTIMSCDEAILYLAQVQEATRTGDGEIAGMLLGFGGGVSKRARATTESVSEKIKKVEAQLQKILSENQRQRSHRAKARWHWLMENITTGKLPHHCMAKVSLRFRTLWLWRLLVSVLPVVEDGLANRSLWNWRSLVSGLVLGGLANNGTCNVQSARKLPRLLSRGWRPTSKLMDVLRTKYNFIWTHSHSFELDNLPEEVTENDLLEAFANILFDQRAHDSIDAAKDSLEVFKIGFQKAGLNFRCSIDATIILDRAIEGIVLLSPRITEKWNDCMAATQAAFHEAKTIYSVHPTDANQEAFRAAKKKRERVKLGLIVSTKSLSKPIDRDWDVVLQPARLDPRTDMNEQLDCMLISRSEEVIKSSSNCIKSYAAEIEYLEKKLVKYEQALEKHISDDVTGMSAFEAIQALQKCDETQLPDCSICLMTLGDNAVAASTANISMTKCGHLFCRGCLQGLFARQNCGHCPCCRKELSSYDIVHIDPTKDENKVERSKKAKNIVSEASRVLEQSNGQLEPSMWNALYHAIDVPIHVDDSRDVRVSSIPRHFMAHLRNATGLPVHCRASETPSLSFQSQCLSSKVKSLLRDLPRDQRSVVFSGSKMMIKHLEFTLENLGIGCRALFSGQKVEDSKIAVTQWQEENGSDIPYPVLLVQAGAAASGLTLTAASKMFIMEPFLRYEEEQQAYARCHRYGQKNPVHCKCYFVPISVESRLLEWRKRATGTQNGGFGNNNESSIGASRTNILYSAMSSLDETDNCWDRGDEDEEEQEQNQTKFLLGLNEDTSEMCMNKTSSFKTDYWD